MTIPDLTVRNFPYLAVVFFAAILILKSIEYAKTKRPGKANVFHPKLAKSAVRNNVGALVPLYDFIGLTQFTAPYRLSNGIFANVVYAIVLFAALFIAELWYGHIGLVLLLLVGLMAHVFLSRARSYACVNNIDDSTIPAPTYCCGGNLLVFLLALCVNLFSTGGITGLIIPLIIHGVIYTGLVLWDYYMEFDRKSQRQHRLCYTMFDRSGMYAVGAVTSLLLLTYVYSVAISFASVALASTGRR
jgi:hypothetical protein